MPLPPNVSCFSKIQLGFIFLLPAHPGSPGKRAVKRVCVCIYIYSQSAIFAGHQAHHHEACYLDTCLLRVTLSGPSHIHTYQKMPGPTWCELPGHSFTKCDIVRTIPHPHLSENARPHLCSLQHYNPPSLYPNIEAIKKNKKR